MNIALMTDEQILEHYGWMLECESPFEISDENGARAKGLAASIVIRYLRETLLRDGFYCCQDMEDYLNLKCRDHGDDPWECADIPLVKTENGKIGIPIRDGGRSMIEIKYCPWCGCSL